MNLYYSCGFRFVNTKSVQMVCEWGAPGRSYLVRNFKVKIKRDNEPILFFLNSTSQLSRVSKMEAKRCCDRVAPGRGCHNLVRNFKIKIETVPQTCIFLLDLGSCIRTLANQRWKGVSLCVTHGRVKTSTKLVLKIACDNIKHDMAK